MEKWVTANNFGNIYIEEVLATLNIPFVFVCLIEGQKYLTLCYNDREGKYILAKCSNYSLIDILRGKLSIDNFLQETNKIFLLDLVDWDRATIQCKDYKNLSSEILPKKDTFFTIKNTSIDKYIKTLKSECKSCNNAEEIFTKMDTFITIKYPNICEYVEILEALKECINNYNIKITKQTNKNKYITNKQKKSNFWQGWNNDAILTYDFKEGVMDGQSSETNKITSAA